MNNRILKFRAWDKDEKKMIEPVELIEMLKQVTKSYDNSKGGDAIRRHDLEWLQFTGVFDKDGTEVYEGDIIKVVSTTMENGETAEVVFSKGAFSANTNVSHPCHWPAHVFPLYMKVIGNIKENPELLTTSQNDSKTK